MRSTNLVFLGYTANSNMDSPLHPASGSGLEPKSLLATANRRRERSASFVPSDRGPEPSSVFHHPAHVVVSGVVVAVNSCPECVGLGTCRNCDGEGKIIAPIQGVPDFRGRCPKCLGQRSCPVCREHRASLLTFAKELEDGSPGSAEACLQRAMMGNVQAEQRTRSAAGIGAAGIGAILGTIVAPGLGTIVGLSLGKMVGDTAKPVDDWKQGDLYYSLGVLYASLDRKAEASGVWIKALTLNEKHDAARTALKEAL